MFQLYDRTRRRIALALFGLLVVLPTVLVLAWAVWLHLPSRLEAEANWLSQQLGAKVSLAASRPQTPMWTVYEGVQLLDAESGQPILFCGRIDVQWLPARVDAQGNRLPTLILSGSEITYDAAQAEPVWQMLERLLARRTGWGDFDVQVSTPQVTLRNAYGSHALQSVQLRFQSSPSASQVEGNFRLAAEASEPVGFRILRNRQTESPETGFVLDTGKTPLPCHLLPACLKLPELLGPQSTVQGGFYAKSLEGVWSGGLWDPNVPLILDNVDFQQLVSRRFPHAWHGTGRIWLQGLSFSHNRLQGAVAWLLAQRGEVSRSLLEACVQRLGLQSPAGVPLKQANVPYEQLVMGFEINPQGIRVLSDPSQVLLRGGGSSLLTQGDMRPKRIEALVQTLLPEGHVEVPTSAQANWLLQHLPLSPSTSSDRTADARVR